MLARYIKAVLRLSAAALLAVVAAGAISGAAQTDVDCGSDQLNKACQLDGYKLFMDRDHPELLILRLKTPGGAYSFAASRLTIEHLGKDLLRDLDNLENGKKN